MFEVGELVKIKDDANKIRHYTITFTDEMAQFCGQVHRIINVTTHGNVTRYKFEDVFSDNRKVNGDGRWVFVEEWLEPYENKEINIEEDELENMFV